MTTKPNSPEFYIRISGITYEDAVTLCGSRYAKAVNNWYASGDDDDCNVNGGGVVTVPLVNVNELIGICSEISRSDDWTDASDWDTALHVSRMTPTYNIFGHLTESDTSLLLLPYRPAIAAADDALSRMQLAMSDLKAAASMLEQP